MIVATVNGVVLKEGDKVKTFRDEEVTFLAADQNGRNRVYCRDSDGHECEWFPGVINAKLETREG